MMKKNGTIIGTILAYIFVFILIIISKKFNIPMEKLLFYSFFSLLIISLIVIYIYRDELWNIIKNKWKKII